MTYRSGAPVSGVTSSALTDTTSTAVIAANAAGAVDLTDFTIQNSHASTATWVQILLGTTVMWRVYCKTDGGGATHRFEAPLVGAKNTAWNVKCETTGTNVHASLGGYFTNLP